MHTIGFRPIVGIHPVALRQERSLKVGHGPAGKHFKVLHAANLSVC
jgi:hypothetical protein